MSFDEVLLAMHQASDRLRNHSPVVDTVMDVMSLVSHANLALHESRATSHLTPDEKRLLVESFSHRLVEWLQSISFPREELMRVAFFTIHHEALNAVSHFCMINTTAPINARFVLTTAAV